MSKIKEWNIESGEPVPEVCVGMFYRTVGGHTGLVVQDRGPGEEYRFGVFLFHTPLQGVWDSTAANVVATGPTLESVTPKRKPVPLPTENVRLTWENSLGCAEAIDDVRLSGDRMLLYAYGGVGVAIPIEDWHDENPRLSNIRILKEEPWAP